jgi:hypothetical protein
MKRSDTAPETISGKFLSRGTGLGTVTEDMVQRRAREIAVTKGRQGHKFTDDDVEEARLELTGAAALEDSDEVERDAPSTGAWLTDAPGAARKTPVRGAGDEQTVAENLVKEGVEEATHHQMLAGNQAKREADVS